MKTSASAPRRRLATSPFADRPEPVIEKYAVDEMVTHDRLGLGRVVAEGGGTVVVAFGSDHVRIPSPFTRLTKL